MARCKAFRVFGDVTQGVALRYWCRAFSPTSAIRRRWHCANIPLKHYRANCKNTQALVRTTCLGVFGMIVLLKKR